MIRVDRAWMLLACACWLATSAEAAPSAKSPAERRADLASIQERINDPDPLMRIAYLEEIVNEGDPLKIEIAIKTAMSIDDPSVRALAMRAYVAALTTVTFDWLYPPAIQAEIDRARDDEKKLDEIRGRSRGLMQYYVAAGNKIPLLFDKFDINSSKFSVFSLVIDDKPTEPYGGEGVVVGDRLIMRLPVYDNNYPCSIEISATPGLELIGKMNCKNLAEVLTIKARMY